MTGRTIKLHIAGICIRIERVRIVYRSLRRPHLPWSIGTRDD
jgi:hypothetical protein